MLKSSRRTGWSKGGVLTRVACSGEDGSSEKDSGETGRRGGGEGCRRSNEGSGGVSSEVTGECSVGEMRAGDGLIGTAG